MLLAAELIADSRITVHVRFKFSITTLPGKGITSGYPVTQEKSRNNPGLLCNLAFGVWNLWLPQFAATASTC
jgi:hypothetical protein